MSEIYPIPSEWTGESFVPHPQYRRYCDQHFVAGETYPMLPESVRSGESHRHYFGCIKAAFESLPEGLENEYPSPEHLRKRALIKCGYAHCRTFVADTVAEARRVAAFLGAMDEFSVVVIERNVVRLYTAESQSLRDMGKTRFEESKNRVIAWLEELLGLEPFMLADGML